MCHRTTVRAHPLYQRPWSVRLAIVAVAALLIPALTLVGCSGPTASPAANVDVPPGPSQPGVNDLGAPADAQPAVDVAPVDAPADAQSAVSASPVVEEGAATAPAEPSPEAVATRPSTVITGRVVDTDGKPVVDAAVSIPSGSAPVPKMAIFTDADGLYSWYVPAGTFTVEVYRDGYVTQQSEVTIGDGESVELDFTMQGNSAPSP